MAETGQRTSGGPAVGGLTDVHPPEGSALDWALRRARRERDEMDWAYCSYGSYPEPDRPERIDAVPEIGDSR